MMLLLIYYAVIFSLRHAAYAIFCRYYVVEAMPFDAHVAMKHTLMLYAERCRHDIFFAICCYDACFLLLR